MIGLFRYFLVKVYTILDMTLKPFMGANFENIKMYNCYVMERTPKVSTFPKGLIDELEENYFSSWKIKVIRSMTG